MDPQPGNLLSPPPTSTARPQPPHPPAATPASAKDGAAHLALRAPPAGYHRFGWFGMSFFLPEDWNLFAYSGDAKRGGCTFADLRLPRLHLRWKPLPRGKAPPGSKWNAPFHLDLDRLREKHPSATVFDLCDRGVQVDIPSVERLLLIHDHLRLYELHYPQAPALAADPLVASFLENIESPPSTSHWYWNAYGAKGFVPLGARLKEVALMPGAPRLTFTHSGGLSVLGALSMADELLDAAEGSLQSLAEEHLGLGALKGEWKQDDATLHFAGKTRGKWLPGAGVPFNFQFLHEPEANQIAWQLTSRVRFQKYWKA